MSIELPPGSAAYSDKNPPPKNHQFLVFIGLFIGTFVLVVWAASWLAGSLVWLIPPSVEQQLGRAIVPTFEQQAQPSAAQDTLNQMLDRLETHLSDDLHEGRNYQVFYIPDDTVNALAIPGDRVIIYRGLLDEMDSENELMMVLGHELGHFANRDHLRGLSRQLTLRLVLATFLGDAGSIGAIASSGASMVARAQFSQQQEYQADEVGLQLLEQEYGHAAGATDFFADLAEMQGDNLAILSTHPASKKRVERLERLIQQNNYGVEERSPLPGPLKQ